MFLILLYGKKNSLKRNLGVLVQELIYGRTLVVRLSMWRSDLSYQKAFISLRMDAERFVLWCWLLETPLLNLSTIGKNSQKSILALNAISASPNLSPLQRLRSFVFVIIAANRMSYVF